MKIACTLQYWGDNYHGSQRQKNAITIQEVLEEKIAIVFREKVRVHFAGRTDQGVHAIAQVIHFSTSQEYSFEELHQKIYGVNALLPRDISLTHFSVVPSSFHARFSCLSREYIYLVLHSPYRMALYERRALWIRHPLSIEKILPYIELFLGEKDFSAFTPKIYQRKKEPTKRYLEKIKILSSPPFIVFYYKASGFLHHMVRILTGTFLEVMLGKRDPSSLETLLKEKDREKSGITLPPYGLYFLRAHYKEYKTPMDRIFLPFMSGEFFSSYLEDNT